MQIHLQAVYEVVSVTPNPRGTALFLTVQAKDGKQYTQQKRPTTLVAAFEPHA